MLNAIAIVQLHDQSLDSWDIGQLGLDAPRGLLFIVQRQHFSNFQIWHLENKARLDPSALEGMGLTMATLKREIDGINQDRNDLIEDMDESILSYLSELGLPKDSAELHSETPGVMIDRLSVLSLKLFYTNKEIRRPDGPLGHSVRNEARLAVLREQRQDLSCCLESLWQGILSGICRFKVYRQLKMYNDPSLNPELYGRCL